MSTKADYIITLIGKNPSPNYYTILNYSKSGTKVYAFYTLNDSESVSSENVLKNIIRSVNEKDDSIVIKSVPCDKSRKKSIEKCVKSEFSNIIKNCDYDNLGSRTVNIIVDYTGSTKSMSAFFYSFYNKIVEKDEYSKLNIHSSYVSSDKGEIYECKFEPVKIESIYEIENVFEQFGITMENLIALHGYKLVDGNQISDIYHNHNFNYKFDHIDIKKGNLRFCITVKCEKIKDLVHKYFEISDEVEKAGGSEAYIDFHVKGYKFKDKCLNYGDTRSKFYDSLSNVYSRDLKEKVTVTFEEENKEENE
ncbi:hypothetical protein LN736_08655 [Clostridium sp. WLY-B-L2]|uniref:CRISPR-associated protein n=1 Tax=Clostridium aromativorans TaxID=2836848 RepID=A0ABS8N536_9CLOT|nr:hypothetical protein [Clostridium aromativorans]MCC9294923.1 hypothetical protein [Clostridium aromativorans]